MKKFLISLFLLIPPVLKSQAHIGASFSELRGKFPDKKFEISYTDEGTKYTSAEQPLGLFIYYLNDANITIGCIQIPWSLESMSAQIEIYNKKYVILSENSWRAYLEGGSTMNIKLEYNRESEVYIFYYTY